MQRIIIAVLALVIVYLIYLEFQRQPEQPQEVTNRQDSVKVLKALVASLETITDTLTIRLEADSLRQAEQALKFKSKIASLTKKLAEKRPEIEPLLDSLPKLAAFVLVQDSIIDMQAQQIDSLERQKARQWNDFNKLLDLEKDKFQAASEMNLHLSAISEHYSEENRKLKRQNRLLKIGVGVAFIGGLALN